MLNKIYDIFNTFSITAWIVVIYLIKEKWTFTPEIHHLIVGVCLFLLLVGFGANLRPGTHGAARFHLDGNAEFESGSFIYLDLGKTLDKSDQIHATGGIDFASDIEGTVTVVVAGNGVGQGSQTTDEAVILADGGLRLNGNILVDGVTLSGNDKVVIRDGGNKLVFQSDGSLTLQSTVVSGEGTELAIHAVGGSQQTTPAPGLSWNQLAVKSGLESAAAGNFANQLMAKYALQGGEEAKQSFLEQLLPTLNSAMPMVTQRAVTQFRQVNFERLRNLHLEPTNRYDQQFEGDRIRRWLQRQGGQAARSEQRPCLMAGLKFPGKES